MEEFANHTVVIVGGAKGIGLATVRLFLEAGAHVLAGVPMYGAMGKRGV